METLTISGQARADVGKKATKADRKNGNIPCVMYAGNEVVHFTATMKDLRGLIYTPNFYKVAVELDGATHQAILKDVQVHPVTEDVLHVDFQKLISGSKVFADIPVKLVGNAEGVKLGGKLLTKVRKLRVRSTPENLIDAIPVDVSSLNLGQSIKVKHIGEQKFQILNSPNIPIASVEIPRALRSKATADAAAKK